MTTGLLTTGLLTTALIWVMRKFYQRYILRTVAGERREKFDVYMFGIAGFLYALCFLGYVLKYNGYWEGF